MKALIALVTALFMSVPVAAFANPPDGWKFSRLDAALVAAREQNKPVFVYFGRHGCPTCERTNRESFTDARVIDAYNSSYMLAYVDSESGQRLRMSNGERISEMELGVRLNVYGTPFFFFTEPSGKPILRAPGYQSADDLMLYHRFVSGGHYREQSLADFKASQP
jgi:thioredoxin-related protein